MGFSGRRQQVRKRKAWATPVHTAARSCDACLGSAAPLYARTGGSVPLPMLEAVL